MEKKKKNIAERRATTTTTGKKPKGTGPLNMVKRFKGRIEHAEQWGGTIFQVER